MKAMILAAGEGRRMRPLTLTTPKPLLKVGEMTLIEHQLWRLKKAGIDDVVINVSYLGEQIIKKLGDGKKYNIHIEYSIESEPLETGGAIYKARSLLGTQPFILVNSDAWMEPDYSTLKAFPLNETDQAVLLFVENPAHNRHGDFCLNTTSNDVFSKPVKGRQKSNGDTGDQNKFEEDSHLPAYTYSGVALIKPSMIENYPLRREAFALKEVFDYAIAERSLLGYLHHGEWVDVGTPERLAALHVSLSCI